MRQNRRLLKLRTKVEIVIKAEAVSIMKQLAKEALHTNDMYSFLQHLQLRIVEGTLNSIILGIAIGYKALGRELKLSLQDEIQERIFPEDYATLRTYFEFEALKISANLRMDMGDFMFETANYVRQKGLPEAEASKLMYEFLKAKNYSPRTAGNVASVFSTGFNMAYNGTIYAHSINNPSVWGFRYWNPDDEVSRPNHAAQNGTTLPKDDPFWQVWIPPNGYRCRCIVEPLREPATIVEPNRTLEPDPGFDMNLFQSFQM